MRIFQQTAIMNKERTHCAPPRVGRKENVSQTFSSYSLLSLKLEIPLPKMKRIKLLSVSQHKHKLFWQLINRQCGIVLKARQVCLPQ
ncbi:hypothetical protein ILYODFUR_010748 [Ilyodon furcidens]|uniref:Uncharacterized protein n=1 Tax=Ilyodon furcidens TaxID=33524 RepID=A0ABV0UJ46_9TELE